MTTITTYLGDRLSHNLLVFVLVDTLLVEVRLKAMFHLLHDSLLPLELFDELFWKEKKIPRPR